VAQLAQSAIYHTPQRNHTNIGFALSLIGRQVKTNEV
jgi:hypothetical protein